MPMRNLARVLLLPLLLLGATTSHAQAPESKPGYTVVVEIAFNEQGAPEETKIFQSDDPTGMQLLNQIALSLAKQVKQPPRNDKEGKPMKFKARAPFNFPMEDDEGLAANNAPKPALKTAPMPAYPENLAASGTVGGAIIELTIGADGVLKNSAVLRSSHPEFANAAYAAVQQWQFVPAQQAGVAVESRWRVALSFSLQEKDPDWKWRVAPRPSLGSFTTLRAKLPPIPAAPAPTETK